MTGENSEVQGQPTDQTQDEKFVFDDDPMLEGMKQAETEESTSEEQLSEAEPTVEAKAEPAEGKAEIMIPKSRLDAVISERELLKNQVAYFQGVADVRGQMLKGQGGDAEAAQGTSQESTAKTVSKSLEDLISDAEAMKITAAEQYEEGEISAVEYEKKKIEADRQIRKLEDDRITARLEATKAETGKAMSAESLRNQVLTEAEKIQAEHPYVQAIDELPQGKAAEAWRYIRAEAAINLQEKGIAHYFAGTDVETPEYIKEIASLTDTYGPVFTKKQLSQPATGTTPALSETAAQRAAKLELAMRQPPDISNAGTTEQRRTITESDILKMTDDQRADLMRSDPLAFKRAVGSKDI